MWIQCKETDFKAIAQKAISLGLDVVLSPKERSTHILVQDDPASTRKNPKMVRESTGYKELGDNDWYLIQFSTIDIGAELINDSQDPIELGPHIVALPSLGKRHIYNVDYNREYLYFREIQGVIRVAHNFTQHFIIRKKPKEKCLTNYD